MKITIDRSAAQELILKKLVLKYFSPKVCLRIAGMIVIGLVMLLVVKHEVNGVKLSFWNFGSALGLGCIMVGLVRVGDFVKRRSMLLDNGSESVIEIDQDEILYKREENQSNFKWRYFQFYQVNSKFILLIKDSTLNQAIIIGRNEITKEQFEFIESQVIKFKIKKR